MQRCITQKTRPLAGVPNRASPKSLSCRHFFPFHWTICPYSLKDRRSVREFPVPSGWNAKCLFPPFILSLYLSLGARKAGELTVCSTSTQAWKTQNYYSNVLGRNVFKYGWRGRSLIFSNPFTSTRYSLFIISALHCILLNDPSNSTLSEWEMVPPLTKPM